MEWTVIIALGLLCIYVFLTIVRENQKQKWYRKGYCDACKKYKILHHGAVDEMTYADEADQEYTLRYTNYE